MQAAFDVLQHLLNNTAGKITDFFKKNLYLCVNFFVLTARRYTVILL